MKTSWHNQEVADRFDCYCDVLEQVLGYRAVFQLLQHGTKDCITLLDYGCGPGKVALRLAELSNKKIIAVDNSENMLMIARAKRAHPLITYCKIFENSLHFIEDATLDGAMACFVFINNPYEKNIYAITKEIYRVLKTGSSFVVLDTHPDSTGIPFLTFMNGLPGKIYGYGENRTEWLHISGQDDLILYDFHWPISMYKKLFKEVGFKSITLHEPTIKNIPQSELRSLISLYPNHSWENEANYPPFVIFQAVK